MGIVSGFLKYKGLKKGFQIIKRLLQKNQTRTVRAR